MSDDEAHQDDEIGVLDNHPPLLTYEHVRILQEQILPTDSTDFLEIPRKFMEPLLMCCSTDMVRILNQWEVSHSSGPELVLLGHGGTTMPEHFRYMLQAIAIINRTARVLNGFAISTGESRLTEHKVGKKTEIIGIEKKVNPMNVQTQQVFEQNFLETNNPIQTMGTIYASQLADSEIYSRQELCTVEWGIIPYEYKTSDDVAVRDVFQTLRIISAPGFNLIGFILSVVCELSKTNKQSDKDYEEAKQMIQYALNHEMFNLGISDVSVLQPLTLSDMKCYTSIASILSPYMILRKMIRFLPGGYCGNEQRSQGLVQSTLCIHGIPSLRTRDEASLALDNFTQKHEAYIEAVNLWMMTVHLRAKEGVDGQIISILTYGNESFSPLRNAVTMTFYPSFKEVRDFVNKRVNFPLLVSTILTNYKFVVMYSSDGNIERWHRIRQGYIEAQCGSDQFELNGVRLLQQYKTIGQVEYPEAGMYMNMRKAMVSLLERQNVSLDVETYMQYINYCYTILREQQLEGFFMSDRVRICADLLRRSETTINANVKHAIRSFEDDLQEYENRVLQDVAFDIFTRMSYLLQRGLCIMNKSTKATPLNLGIIQACIISDILCFLGMDNTTWTWCFFPILVCGGGGHLRAQTEEAHSARAECPYVAKASSVGFNAVIVNTINALLGLCSHLFPSLRADDVKVLQFLKLDRVTRVAIEERSAIITTDGKVTQVPDTKFFMSLNVFDELSRNVNNDAIDGLITSGFPRDKNGGGTTQKSAESLQRGPRVKQDTHIQRGMGFFSIVNAQNRHASNSHGADCYKALISGAMACYVPSGQPSKGFSVLRDEPLAKRHCCNAIEPCNTVGESQMPSLDTTLKTLAWAYCMIPMNCRNIALMNKMAMSEVTVNQVEQQIYMWFSNIIFSSFKPFIGETLVGSFSRVMNGYLARGVATSFQVTNALQLCQHERLESANVETTVQMESGISLHGVHNAILEGLSHLLDFNLILTNHIVADKLGTPTFTIPFLRTLFNEDDDIGTRSEFRTEVAKLRAWINAKFVHTAEYRMQHGYALVPGLDTKEDYVFYSQYLEQYCSIIPGSKYTYSRAIGASAIKVLDMSAFLSLRKSMLRCNYSRVGVDTSEFFQADSDLVNNQHTFIHLIHKPERNDRRLYVHVAQHLLMTAMLEGAHLHSDNVYSLGRFIFKFIVEEAGIQQQIPAGLISNSFGMQFGKVTPIHVKCNVHMDTGYMLRSRMDFTGWTDGNTTELNGLLAQHPIEDVIHLGNWIHMYQFLHAAVPSAFVAENFPMMRPPELVPGRLYPVMSKKDNVTGTLCICPDGKNYVRLGFLDGETHAIFISMWTVEVLCEHDMQVAPLIYRSNAVVHMHGKLGVIISQNVTFSQQCLGWRGIFDKKVRQSCDIQYIDTNGEYEIRWEDGSTSKHQWTQVHECLLRLGTHVYVKASKVKGVRVSARNASHIRGSLRYPDESNDERDESQIFINFRCGDNEFAYDGSVIVGCDIADCSLVLGEGEQFVSFVQAVV